MHAIVYKCICICIQIRNSCLHTRLYTNAYPFVYNCIQLYANAYFSFVYKWVCLCMQTSMLLYANAYALSKKFNLNLYIDPYSGYKKHNIRSFMLDNFNISSTIASPEWIFSNNYRNLIKKIKIKYDFLKKKKSFFFELKDKNKLTKFNTINLNNMDNAFYIDGNFESEKYFLDYKKDLMNEFSFKNDLSDKNN